MNLQQVLHLLRNPHGHSEEELREARLKAADMLEHSLKFWMTANAALKTYEERMGIKVET